MPHVALVLGLFALITSATSASITAAGGPDGPTDDASGWTSVRGPHSVAPSGWRRTVNGWELADLWPAADASESAVSINRLIRSQQKSESQHFLVRRIALLMRWVRALDPVTLFASQLTLIALLVALRGRHGEPRAERGPGLSTAAEPTADGEENHDSADGDRGCRR